MSTLKSTVHKSKDWKDLPLGSIVSGGAGLMAGAMITESLNSDPEPIQQTTNEKEPEHSLGTVAEDKHLHHTPASGSNTLEVDEHINTTNHSGGIHIEATPTNVHRELEQDLNVEFLYVDEVETEAGSMQAAVLSVDGHLAVLGDIDHNGQADVLAVDLNNNYQLDEHDLVQDIRGEGLDMPNMGSTYTMTEQDASTEEVQVLGIETFDNGSGYEGQALWLEYEGREGLVIDVDADGTPDFFAADCNADEALSHDEIAAMQSPHNEDFTPHSDFTEI